MKDNQSDLILQRMMELHPKIIDLTLDRVFRLLSALGNPHHDLPPVIHIAGTNGKGSTQAMIRAGLEAAGKRVQAFTSPHLTRFHERIRLSDGLISEPALEAVLAECETANGDASITYFEITTVASILAFARDKADYCLLEVGLGGRLDATNIIDQPRLCAITPIALDHQQFLGETIEEIAFEKAGILKPGVPCIVAPQSEAALDVIEARARELDSPLLIANQDWQVYEEHGRLAFQDETGLMDLPRPALAGAHQVQNAGTALAALRALGIDAAGCAGAMSWAKWPARMQPLRQGPIVAALPEAEIWLDGGHNPAAGQALANAFDAEPPRETVLICGMLKTKDVSGFLQPLRKVATHLIAVSIEGEAATLSADETKSVAQEVGFEARTADSVIAAAIDIAREKPQARVLICGSLYLAGQVLRNNS